VREQVRREGREGRSNRKVRRWRAKGGRGLGREEVQTYVYRDAMWRYNLPDRIKRLSVVISVIVFSGAYDISESSQETGLLIVKAYLREIFSTWMEK
jgi:hypothetical protein